MRQAVSLLAAAVTLAGCHQTVRCVAGHPVARDDSTVTPSSFIALEHVGIDYIDTSNHYKLACDTVAVFSRIGREVPHTRRFWADVVDSVQHAGRKSGTVGQK